MFGLEKEKKRPKEEFFFDIENECKNPSKKRAYLEKIQARMHKLKDILNAGIEQEDLQHLSILLQGYSSLFKVFSRKVKSKI